MNLDRYLDLIPLFEAAGRTSIPVKLEDIKAMATGHKVRVGKVDKKALAQGKVQPVDKTPAPLRKGKAMKADRTAKAYKAKGKAA